MPDQNVGYFFGLEQSVVNVERRSTGVSKDVLDTFVFKGANDHIAAGQHFHGHSPSRCFRGWQNTVRVKPPSPVARDTGRIAPTPSQITITKPVYR